MRRVILLALSILLVITATPAAVASPDASSGSAAGSASTASAASISRDDKPLIIVLDISGSMDDDDGTGTVKLQSAKLAVERAVRARGTGSVMGVWAFPGDDQCSAGSMTVPPEPQTDLSSVIASVDALTTSDGGTPIGKALQSTASALTLKGFAGATMLLVTDGLNNCDPDPCPIATSIVKSGFDLTVDAVGFRAEEGTEDALSCIANATGGSVTDATDGPALQKVLEKLAVPSLKTAVAAPTTVLAGQTAHVQVTINNPSSNDAMQVRTNLAFTRSTTKSLLPTVNPPTWDVGNLPAGGSQTYSWDITTERSWKGSIAEFAVTTWTVGGQSLRDEGAFRLLENAVRPDSALFQGISAKRPLVILGDSYSSGEGANDYVPQTKSAAGKCHRSFRTTLSNVLDPAEVRIIACSGALISDLTSAQHEKDDGSGPWLADAQIDQLRNLDDPPAAVLLTFGGNDAKFADVVKSCVVNVPTVIRRKCDAKSAFAKDELQGISGRWRDLLDVYTQVWQVANQPKFVAARGGAYASVIVSTYPQAFWAARRGQCSLTLSAAEIGFGNDLATALMASSKHAAAAAAAAGYEVYFSANPLEAFQPDHTYCAPSDRTYLRQIGGVGLDTQQIMHPNQDGYLALTTSLTTWAGSVSRTPPTAAAKATAGSLALPNVLGQPVQVITPTVVLRPGEQVQLTSGSAVVVQVEGFAPNTPVVLTLHSEPVSLGTLVVGADGSGSIRVVVPDRVSLGAHHLQATGFDGNGNDRIVRVRAAVVQPIPVWVALCLLLAVLVALGLLIAAVVAAVRRGRRSRGPKNER